MWSLAQRMAISTQNSRNIQNSREYPSKNLAAITRGLRPLVIAARFLDGYSLSFWIFTLVFRAYFAIRFAKLNILPQLKSPRAQMEGCPVT